MPHQSGFRARRRRAVEGVDLPDRPVIVAEQLPDSNRTKKVSLAFREAYQKANNAPTTDAFSAYSFDGWLVLVDAAKRALAKAQPGTPEFRQAFKDAMVDHKEVVGTHGVYNFKPDSYLRCRRARPRAGEARTGQVEAAAVSRAFAG
jgi:branched-chain amino acid transport system substrate-binding protein